MKKLIVEEERTHKITRNSDINKILVEDKKENKVIRSKDMVIVRKQNTTGKPYIITKNEKVVVRKQDTQSVSAILK